MKVRITLDVDTFARRSIAYLTSKDAPGKVKPATHAEVRAWAESELRATLETLGADLDNAEAEGKVA